MDPISAVSLAASVGGLVQLTCGITKLSYGYFSSVKNAGEAQKAYRHEVAALMEVLFQLERALDSSDTADVVVNRAAELTHIINQCREDLSAVQFKLSQASNHFSKFIWPLKSKELKEQVEKIHRLRSIIGDFVSSIILVVTSQTHAPLKSLTVSQERTQLLSRLPPHRDVSKPRPMPCPGTGAWFTDSHPFRGWLGNQGGLLWCYGPPGVGKSRLASAAVEYLLEQQKQRPFYLCHFFCDYALQDRQNTVSVLQSLVCQLIEQADTALLGLAQAHLALLDTSNNPDNLKEFLRATRHSGTNTVVVFDAEDEMNRHESIVDFLFELSSLGCHVLVTSRMIRPVAGDFTATVMPIDASGADIEKYVKYRFRHNEMAVAAMDTHLFPRIVERSNGLFLLSKLLVDQLLEFPTVSMMLRFLESAPKDLDQAFEATLARINAQPPAFRHLAHRTLGWAVNVRRPLSARELLHAFAVEDGWQDEIQDHSLTTSQLVVRSCAGFVTVDEQGTVRLAHESIYTFCAGQMKNTREIKDDISRTCIRYLRLKPMSSGPCTSVQELMEWGSRMPFLMYAAKNVGHHMPEALAAADETTDLMLQLITNTPCRETMWQALLYNTDLKTPFITEDYFQSLPLGPTALHVAAYWNMHAVCEQLLSRGHPVSPTDSQQWTPLHWAAANGCEAVADLLLRSGASIDAQESGGWTPLFWASFEGHASVVQALLLAGANHTVSTGQASWTALHWAISRNNMEVVRLLISHDRKTRDAQPTRVPCDTAEPHAEPERPPPAEPDQLGLDFFDDVARQLDLPPVADWRNTHCASIPRGRVEAGYPKPTSKAKMTGRGLRAFRPLISNLAWRNHRKVGIIATAQREEVVASRPERWKEILLQSAIAAGNLPAAQLLLELGADVDIRDPDIPFVQSAVRLEDPRFAELLLSNAADASVMVNTPLGGRTLLHHALMYGSEAKEDTISCLIGYGADVNATADDGETVLEVACTGGMDRAELILRSGARPRWPESEHWWRYVKPDSVKCLLDLFARFDKGRSPAEKASETSDASGETALTQAMACRNWDVVKLLASLGGYVPPAARIQRAVRGAIDAFGDSRPPTDTVATAIDLAIRNGARLGPDNGAVLQLLAKCNMLGKERAWHAAEYEEQCCRILSQLVSAGCSLDFHLAQSFWAESPYQICMAFASGRWVEHIVAGSEGVNGALFMAENWLHSDMIAKTIVALSPPP